MKGQDNQITQLTKHLDKRFDAIDRKFETIDKRFEAVDRRFDAVDKRLDSIDFRLGAVEAQLTSKAEKMDFDRLYNSLDAILSQQEVEEQERLTMKHQLDRHELAITKMLYARAGRIFQPGKGSVKYPERR